MLWSKTRQPRIFRQQKLNLRGKEYKEESKQRQGHKVEWLMRMSWIWKELETDYYGKNTMYKAVLELNQK